MATWMVPAISIMICSTAIMIITYSYLFYIKKQAFMGKWIISWSIYLFAQILTLFTISDSRYPILVTISLLLFLCSALFLLWGTYSFFNKKMSKWWTLLVVCSICWLIISTYFKLSVTIITLPTGSILGLITLWVGLLFYYYGREQRILHRILGTCFTLWGIHKLDYPFLRNISWVAPWGYILSAGFCMMITITFIFIYMEKTRFELMEIQKGLQVSEKRLVNIIENQRDIIFEVNSDGKLIYVSPACEVITGFKAEEIREISFVTLLGADFWGELQQKSNGVYFERVWTKKDNAPVCVSIYCKPNFNFQEKFDGAFGSIHDLTENKLLDEAREYDKLKTEFFANISHELRTPLNVMMASAQLLELYNKKSHYSELSGQVDKTVMTIRNNIFRLLRLVNNLIDITRVDTGYFDVQLRNCNIVSVIEEITMSVVDYVESKELSIQFDTDVEEKIIGCDIDKIERVLLNLLSNSIKFTPVGGSIFIKVKDGTEFINISVKDTGIGIAKDKHKMIFERFRQVDKSLSRNNEGSGIGLSLVKSIVELHGGSIDVISGAGRGSEFIIALPVKQACSVVEVERLEEFSPRKIEIEFSDIYL